MTKYTDLVGQSFGELTVIKRVQNSKSNKVQWLCECTCGNTCVVRSSSLISGVTKSCGCYSKKVHSTQKGLRAIHSRLYSIWYNLLRRCENASSKSYKYYGGKGIKVCEEWHDFETFVTWAINSGYKDNLTIDRVDNKGNYEPSNCKWSSMKEQGNNKGNNKVLSYGRLTLTISQWSDKTGLHRETIQSRLRNGWSVEDTLTIKKNGRYNKGKEN